MQQAGSAFAGVAFHCYSGDVSEQNDFHTQYPQKEIYFTECSGTIGSDWWSDIKVCVASQLSNGYAAYTQVFKTVVHGQLVCNFLFF